MLTRQCSFTYLPGYQKIVAPPDETRGGTAILISPSIPIISSGTLQDNELSWVLLQTACGEVGIANIYAPNHSQERAFLWNSLKTSLSNGRWIFTGDFNMTESATNSTGPSPLLTGTEKEAWRLLRNRFDLADALTLLGRVTGPHFTRRGFRKMRLDQSRIDRFYIGDQGWWLGRLVELAHITDQPLSEHDPIMLKLHLTIPDPLESKLRRSS